MRRYPDEIKAFILEHYKGISTRELTNLVNKQFGLTLRETQLYAYKQNHKLLSGAPTGAPAGYSPLYTAEQQAFIREHCGGRTTCELAELINQTFGASFTQSQMKAYLGSHRLVNGVNCRFKKGQAPPNKGKTWDEFMSKDGQEKSRWTTFKKGNIPVNHKPVGSERVDKYGYIMIKIREPNKYVFKHRYLWEQAHGALPKGYIVIFLDGNRLNCCLDNLALVSLAENARLNRSKLRYNDKSLTQTGISIVKLMTALSGRSRKQ